MEQYIPKSVLLAEIDRQKIGYNVDGKHSVEYDTTRKILNIIDTLEVKEVDLEKEIDDYIAKGWEGIEEDKYLYGMIKNDISDIAKHFFELGLKAKDWKNKRMKECSFRQNICNRYKGTQVKCDGKCSWVVDYPKLKEFKAQKGE